MKLNGRKVATGALAAAAAMALCGALAGCSANGASTSASSSDSTATEPDNHVVLGYWGGTCEAPIYVGYEKGFFQEEGLDPEMLLITSDVAPLMANDELDCFELTPDKFKPMEQGLEVKIADSLHIGCIQGAARADSGITSVADLEGKKVAADLGSVAQIQIASQMVEAGKDPSKVEWLTYPIAQKQQAMEAGEVDAFADYDPWTDLAVADGAVKFYSNTFDEGLKDNLCCFVGVSSKTLEENPELGPKLSRAFKKANEYITANPEECADIIVNAGYVPVNTDSGFTKDIMLDEIKAYTWVSGDKKLLDDSFYNIWMQVNRAGAMEDAPSDEAELIKYINETLYNRMVAYQGE